MGWMSKHAKAIFYGIEYLYPQEADDYIFTKDYCFTYTESYTLEIFLRVLNNLSLSSPDLAWQDPDRDSLDDYVMFTCKESTYNQIDYTMNAWTDGYGYAIEVFD